MKMENNILGSTLDGINLFSDEIKKSIILHIPHSSSIIPNTTGYDFDNSDIIDNDIKLSTDWMTDKIFDIKDVTKLVYPYSRLYCDVERLEDNLEANFKKGRGFFYTESYNGKTIREDIDGIKQYIYENEYLVHHSKLTELVQSKLDLYGTALIIDCHSFSNDQFGDERNDENLPDICLGTDDIHTPEFLYNYFKNSFEKYYLDVKRNYPYSGTIVPGLFYGDKRVKSIMIEINKDLFNINNDSEIAYLNLIITNLLTEF